MYTLRRRTVAAALLLLSCGVSLAALPPRFVISDRQGSTLRVFAQDAFFSGVQDYIPPTTVNSIPVGSTPQETATSPNGRISFVANFNSGYVSVVDLTIGAEIRRIPNILARSVALNAGGTRMVASVAADQVVVVDTQSLTEIGRIQLPAGTNPQQLVVSGDRIFVNARGFVSPQPVVTFDLAAFVPGGTNVATAISGTARGFGPPKGGAMVTPDGRVVMLRSGNPYEALVMSPSGTLLGTIPLNSAAYALAASNTHLFALHASNGAAFPRGLAIFDLNTGAPAGNAPLSYLPETTPFASNGFFQMALSPDLSRLVAVGAAADLSPKITGFDVGALLLSPSTATPLKAFDLVFAELIRDVHVAPAVASPPAGAPTVSVVCLPATLTVTCPKAAPNDAPAPLTVYGTGFVPGARVRIGNSAALLANFVSPTQLTVTVPAGLPAQTADVVVTLPGTNVFDQHLSGVARRAFNIMVPSTFQPRQQVVAANFGDSTIIALNSAVNQAVTDAVPVGIQPISIDMLNSTFAVVQSFGPARVNRRSILQYEDRPPFVTLGTQSGQVGVIAVRPAVLPGLIGPATFAWSLYTDPVSGPVPALTVLQSGAAFYSRQKIALPGATLWALAVDLDGRYAYGVSQAGGTSRLHIFDVAAMPLGSVPGTGTTVDKTLASLSLGPVQFSLQVTPDGNSLVGIGTAPNVIQFVDISNRVSPIPSISLTGPAGREYGDVRVLDLPGVGRRVYAWDPGNLVLDVFAPGIGRIGSVTVPGSNVLASQIVVTPDGKLAYAAISDEDSVAAIDLTKVDLAGSAGAFLTKIRTGLSPLSLALVPPAQVDTTTTGVQLTPTWTNVVGQLVTGITVSFPPGSITSPGALTATTTGSNPAPLPTGFSVGDVPIYYEITAGGGLTFTGRVRVCFPVDRRLFPNLFTVRIKHYVGGAWVDEPTVASPPDTVCADVTSFSPFVLGEYKVGILLGDLSRRIDELTGNKGLINSLAVKAQRALATFDAGALTEVRDALTALSNQIRAQSDKKLLSAAEAQTLLDAIGTILANLQ